MSGSSLQATKASVADFSTFMVAGALEKPCLGRPFQLGMLYDCRSDALIPGVTLWGSEALNTALSKKPFETSDFEIIAEDSLSEKLLHLDVDASLKLSILSGLVQVEGAAKFLYDQKSSKKQARVSLKYKSTTRFEQLTMDTLGNFEYTDVFEKDIATHVVTGMVYGADAFFVFDREIRENENMKKIHGNLKVEVGGLPGLEKLASGGEGSVDVTTGDKEGEERLHCKFYGDLILPKHPATFHDAAKVYQEMPELLQGKSVPKKVCLYPLGKLDNKAQRMVRQISSRLVDELHILMESLHDIIMRGNDLIKTEVCSNFLGLKDDLESMKGLISGYRADLEKNLATLLPKVRGGGTDETKVAEILKKNSLSPFCCQTLSGWISGKENEVKILAGYLKHLKEQEVIQLAFEPGAVDVIVNDLEIEAVVCFDFGITWGQDALLLKMGDYLRNGEVGQGGSTPQPWYRNQALMKEMRQQFRCFKSFAIPNHRREATRFICTNSDSENDTETAFVSLYESGCESKFEAPDKPGKPQASNISHTGLQVNWDMPKYSASVQSYTVSYTDDESSDQWCTQTTSGTEQQLVLSRLVPGTAYFFKVSAETKAGCSPDSDVCMIMLPPSAPSKPHASSITHNSLQLNWNKPSHGSDTVQSYTIFYQPMSDGDDWNSYKLANNQQEYVHLSDLVPKTAYVFKVRAESAVGPSPDSEISDSIQTLLPISEPGKPTATRVTHNFVALQWDKPEQSADIVKCYTIFYRRSVDDPDVGSSWHTHKTSNPLETAQLSDLFPQTAYVFKVRAESIAGASPDSEISDPIETLLPISQPGKPRKSKVSHNSITLEWDKPERGVDIVEHYTIFYRRSVDDPDVWNTLKTCNQKVTATVINLNPKMFYIFKVKAESAIASSPESESSDPIETLLPISQPGKPIAADVTHNCITLRWLKPEHGSHDVQCYTILYRDTRSGINNQISINASRAHDYSEEVVKLPNFGPNTEYTFKVRAESNTGVSPDSELSDPIRTLVPVSQPGKPNATQVTHDSVTLKWERPKQGAQYLKHYKVIYYSTEDSENTTSYTAKAEKITLPNLNPKCVYIFKVKAETFAGSLSESEISDPIETLLSPPGKPYATDVTYKGFHVNWHRPSYPILHYSVYYQTTNDPPDKWNTKKTIGDMTRFPFPAAKGNFYVFKVVAVTSAGVSSESELSDPIETKAEPWGAKIYKSLNPMPNTNPPTYLLPTHCVMKKKDIVKVHVGANSHGKTKKGIHTSCSCNTRAQGVRHKVLMVVGATGAGKTTLINGMANYIMNVQWDDEFRFRLIAEATSQDQSKSQTMCITAYTFYKESGSNLPYTLTVIDTPGFGDTGGLKRDKYIVSQIKELFSIAGDEGIVELHGIGFVAPAPSARLTPTQQYVFDAILSVFGKDVADNIFLMITFADGMKPPVLDAVKAADVPNKAFFKFNNSALFASKSADDEFDKMFWKMGSKSFDEFFQRFSNAQAQSLQLSREVIQERETLEVTIQGLQPQIQLGLSKIDELRQERQMLKDHEAKILTNQDFTYKVEVTKQRIVDLPTGIYTTNCLTCNYTCHDDCAYNDDDDKYRCSAMRSGRGTPNAECGICPQKCSWKMHKNNPYRFELYKENETRTSDELKKKYESAMSSKEQLECVIKDMKKELDTMNMAVLRKMEQARRSVQRLQEIALKPNYLTEVEYIDLIIETEKREAKPRWLERVQALEGVRQQAEIVTELMKNPPQGQQQYVFSIEETAQEKSMWQKFLHKFW